MDKGGIMSDLMKMNNIIDIEYLPAIQREEKTLGLRKVSLDDVVNLSNTFKPIIEKILTGENSGGLAYVKMPKNAKLLTKKVTGNNIGTYVMEGSNKIAGQAELISIPVSPADMFMTVAMARIESKLNEIRETQIEILDFLKNKEKSKFRGNLNTLISINDNYKFNMKNEKYKTNKHILVQQIKNEAEQGIVFYRTSIEGRISSDKFIIRNNDINKNLKALNDEFAEYQLSLYLYSFSSYLEVLLMDNYNSQYLNKIYSNITNKSHNYRTLYTKGYNFIDKQCKKSVEKILMKGINNADGLINDLAKKSPLKITKGKSSKFKNFLNKNLVENTEKQLKEFTHNHNSKIQVFIDQIKTVEKIYSNDIEVYVDQHNLYLSK